MEIAIGLLLLLLVLAIAFPVLAGRGQRKAVDAVHSNTPGAAGEETLRYRVPDGQDPAVVMAALETAGHRTAVEDEAGEKYLVISCPKGRDASREEARKLIEEADRTSLEGMKLATGRVAFEDEK
jgi:hypothetical protein